MDGITAVQLRINDLRSRFEAPPVDPSSASSAATLGSTTSSQLFASALAQAQRTSGTGSTTGAAPGVLPADPSELRPAARLAPGQYGSLQPPAELVGYGNGKVPASALASIGDGHALYAPAARAFLRMVSDARAQGITIGVNESYRDLAAQQQLVDQLGLYSQGGTAAAPGTSNHGWGLALDLELDPRAQQWMRDNAYRYGFAEDVPREPWHWTYRPS